MLPGLADGTIDGESNSSDNRESESSKEVRLIAPLPSHGNDNKSSSPCGSLNKLPLEVRNMIYTNVMKYKKSINRPHRFLGRQQSILAEDNEHIQVIDATLLRTCKAIYYEAIHILYGKNRFYFLKPSDIEDFAHLGLGNIPFGFYGAISKSASVVNNAPCGRLTMIRWLYLKLSSENYRDDLQKVWSFWSNFFYPPEKQDHLVGFPALERLSLDLTDWRLGGVITSNIRVCPIARISSHLHHRPVCPDARPFPLGFGR